MRKINVKHTQAGNDQLRKESFGQSCIHIAKRKEYRYLAVSTTQHAEEGSILAW